MVVVAHKVNFYFVLYRYETFQVSHPVAHVSTWQWAGNKPKKHLSLLSVARYNPSSRQKQVDTAKPVWAVDDREHPLLTQCIVPRRDKEGSFIPEVQAFVLCDHHPCHQFSVGAHHKWWPSFATLVPWIRQNAAEKCSTVVNEDEPYHNSHLHKTQRYYPKIAWQTPLGYGRHVLLLVHGIRVWHAPILHCEINNAPYNAFQIWLW
jgi:hypothetical protein